MLISRGWRVVDGHPARLTHHPRPPGRQPSRPFLPFFSLIPSLPESSSNVAAPPSASRSYSSLLCPTSFPSPPRLLRCLSLSRRRFPSLGIADATRCHPFLRPFLSLLSLPHPAVSTRVAPPARGNPPRAPLFYASLVLFSTWCARGGAYIRRVGRRDPFFSSPCPLLPGKGASPATSETTQQRVHPPSLPPPSLPPPSLSLSLSLPLRRVAATRKKQRKERHVASGRVPLLIAASCPPYPRLSPNARATRVDREKS